MADPAPTQAKGHGGGTSFMAGTPYDPAEMTAKLIWPDSIRVYDQMRRQDPQVKSVLNALTLPIRRTEWRLDPNGAPEQAVVLMATDLGVDILDADIQIPRHRQAFDLTDHIRHALLYLPYGHMPFAIGGEIRADGFWHLSTLGPRMPATIAKINVAPSGELIGIEQWPDGSPGTFGMTLEIPANQLLFYCHEREAGLWQGNSILRSAYKHWLIKDRLIRVDAMKHERNGMGIPTVEMAQGATPSQIEEANRIASKIRAGEAVGGALPAGASLRLRGVEGALPDTLGSIRYHDEQIGQEALTQFMQLGKTETGSRALGSVLVEFFVMALQAKADDLANTFNEQLLERWTTWNFGEDVPAPRLVPADLGTDHSVTAEALAALVQSGALVADDGLDAWIRQNFRMPDRDPESSPRAPRPEVVVANRFRDGQQPSGGESLLGGRSLSGRFGRSPYGGYRPGVDRPIRSAADGQ